MSPSLPYHIVHIYLHQRLNLPDLDYQRHGNYLVFWWHEIALGQSFIKPGRKLTPAIYYTLLIEAILPAIQFYARKTEQSENNWQALLQHRQFSQWLSWMDGVFLTYTTASIPATVPVSVIICTRNRASALKQCLHSIKKMCCQPAEIIIVENARLNNDTEKLLAAYSDVIYIEEPTPGLSYARNRGISVAKHPIVAFTDDDVLVHPNWIYQVWQTFTQTDAAAITGLVIADSLSTEAQLIFEQHWSFNRGYVDKIYDTQYFQTTLAIGPPVWEIGAGANAAFRKEIFSQVGYFDERLGAGASGCSEDSEVWYKILAHGHTICYTPRAIVYHGHRNSLKALHRQIFSYMKGFTAAALIQQQQHSQAGYKKHLFQALPKSYLLLILKGFPRYRTRYKTLGSEIKGVFSGLIFYWKNRKKPAFSKSA